MSWEQLPSLAFLLCLQQGQHPANTLTWTRRLGDALQQWEQKQLPLSKGVAVCESCLFGDRAAV